MPDSKSTDGGVPSWQSQERGDPRDWRSSQPHWQRPAPLDLVHEHRSRMLWWLLAVLGALLVAAFAMAVVSTQRERAKVGQTLKTYVAARAANDAGRACDQMTPGERRDMVAHDSGERVSTATREQCTEWVLTANEASPATSRAFDRFRANGYEFKIDFGPNREVARVFPAGYDSPAAELIKVDGRWKLDGLAFEKVSFGQDCSKYGYSEARCRCIFDRLREHQYDSWDEYKSVLLMMRERVPSGDIDSARATCEGSADAGTV